MRSKTYIRQVVDVGYEVEKPFVNVRVVREADEDQVSEKWRKLSGVDAAATPLQQKVKNCHKFRRCEKHLLKNLITISCSYMSAAAPPSTTTADVAAYLNTK